MIYSLQRKPAAVCGSIHVRGLRGGSFMTCQEHLVRYFRENRVKYTILPQHPRAFAALQIARYEHVPPGSVAKVVIVWIGERIAMLVLPASKQVNFHKLQAIS